MYDDDWPSGPAVTDEMVQAAMRAYDAAHGDNDYVSLNEIRMRAALEAALGGAMIGLGVIGLGMFVMSIIMCAVDGPEDWEPGQESVASLAMACFWGGLFMMLVGFGGAVSLSVFA